MAARKPPLRPFSVSRGVTRRAGRPSSFQSANPARGASIRSVSNNAGLVNQIRRARTRLGEGGPIQRIMLDVNQKSVDKLAEFAVEAFTAASGANGHDSQSRSGALVRAIRDPNNHKVTAGGFEYFIGNRVYRTVRYWRAIEEGSRASVGRRIPITFLRYQGPGKKRTTVQPAVGKRARNFEGRRDEGTRPRVLPGRERTDPPDNAITRAMRPQDRPGYDRNRPRGRREPGVDFITVRRPIPAYRYNRTAIARFNTARVYQSYLRGAQNRFAALGVPLTVP